MTREDKKNEGRFTMVDLTSARQRGCIRRFHDKIEGSIASQSMVIYLVAEGIDSEDPNEGIS